MIIIRDTKNWTYKKMLLIANMLIKKDNSVETELVLSLFDDIFNDDLKKSIYLLLK